MRYRLYGWRQTGSMAIEAALEEAGVPYDFVPVSRATDENLSEAFARINPRQQVPALALPDGTLIAEGPAMLSHIGDAHPAAGLIPAPGRAARAQHDRWMAYFHCNVYEAMLRQLKPGAYTTDPAGAAGVKAAADDYINRHFRIFEATLGDGPYLMGAGFQMFDIYLWMLNWWMDDAWLAAECPRIHRLGRTANSRPVLAAVAARHFG